MGSNVHCCASCVLEQVAHDHRGQRGKFSVAGGAASVAPCNPVVVDRDFPMRRLFLLRNIEGATDAGTVVRGATEWAQCRFPRRGWAESSTSAVVVEGR
jgi:hypothetical protein